MRSRRFSFIVASSLLIALAGCDANIAFPGFDDRPSERDELPPPPNLPADIPPPPVLPIDTSPTPDLDDRSPDPETDDPADDGTPVIDELPDTVPTEQAPDDAGETDATPGSDETPSEDDTPAEAPDTDEPVTGPVTGPLTGDDTQSTDPDEPAESADAPDDPNEPVEGAPAPVTPAEPTFAYHAPGDLIPGSGLGSPDQTVYAPDMVFPIQTARTFPQSQVFRPGGFRYDGDLPGDECIPQNYEYPWRDNFCERGRSSSFKTPHCPAGSGIHLGQDIRVGDGRTCESMRRRYRTNTQSITDYKVVAAEDGVISNISTYTVTLRAGPRTYRYLHLNMRALQVSIGDEVAAGQLLGYVSKDFGFSSNGNRRPTTFHLHFEIRVNTDNGSIFVPPYTSLVESYARREGGPGEEIERVLAVASDAALNTSKEVFEFSE